MKKIPLAFILFMWLMLALTSAMTLGLIIDAARRGTEALMFALPVLCCTPLLVWSAELLVELTRDR